MKPSDRLGSACVLSVWTVLSAASGAGAEELRNHFDTDSAMRAPGFFDILALGDAGADSRWLILVDPNPPSAPNRLAQVNARRPAGSTSAALRRNVDFQDGGVSTFVKKGPGQAGLVLRLVDAKNFLLLLADTQTGEVVLTSHRDGKAAELGRGQGAFQHEWEKIGVTLEGPSVKVSVGDKALFAAADPRPASGRFGVAASGPGESSFDEFVLVY
jgi:hypothetical protein